jgi:hypothetical protein
LLTVQPLYQSDGKIDTVFIQASQLRYALYGDERDTTNLGLGYRRLLLDKTLLVGANSFYDREWTHEHQRVGFGGEAMWRMFDLHANGYLPVTGDRTADGTAERALTGWDSELRAQVPYLPWAKLGVQRYVWISSYTNTDLEGWAFTADMDLTPNVSVEVGTRTAALPGTGTGGTDMGANMFATVSFHLADNSRPAATTQLVADQAFTGTEDMSGHTLDKVRRENRILVERKGLSLLVGRSG